MTTSAALSVLGSFRFGFGLGHGAMGRAGDVRAALLATLERPQLALIRTPDLPDTSTALGYLLARRAEVKARSLSRAENMAQDGMSMRGGGAEMAERPAGESQRTDASPTLPPGVPPVAKMLGAESQERVKRVVDEPEPFLERLAWHWFNHFTVSARATTVGILAGPYDREAIRPNILGRFETLLMATALHPAMLFYLNNESSIGPNSLMARNRAGRGLNENLAREILELHTLGVDGGYRQDDVIQLARVLTGWTVNMGDRVAEGADRLAFDHRRHEPGPKTILGKTYREDGPEEIRAVLRDLALHPSTARHVTRRLADHFVGMGRAPGLRKALLDSFLSSGGDLKVVTRTLVSHDEAWTTPRLKSTSPFELVCSVGRMLGKRPEPPRIESTLQAMGQPFWRCPAPAGWSEADDAWIAPDALKTRLDWALEVGARHGAGLDVRQLADQTFGPALSAPTRNAIARADSPQQALALLIMSPELQRR